MCGKAILFSSVLTMVHDPASTDRTRCPVYMSAQLCVCFASVQCFTVPNVIDRVSFSLLVDGSEASAFFVAGSVSS